MKYTVILPLGARGGIGTYDTFFNRKKYKNWREALVSKDVVVCNFVKGGNDVIFFAMHHFSRPSDVRYHRLGYQWFPAGVDVSDDDAARRIATELLAH